MKVVVATRSTGKMREIRRILGEVPGLEVLGLDEAGVGWSPEEEALEPFDTFEANALSKARYYFDRVGLPTVADDSGIAIDALEGAPGVRSKRFAADAGAAPSDIEGQDQDDANNRHLVERLRSVPEEQRTARYVCVAVFLDGASDPLVVRGEAPGVIKEAPSGSGGFGYDPFVYDPELGKTFAEMTPEEKDTRSHRGRAFRALAAELVERVPPGSTTPISEDPPEGAGDPASITDGQA